MKLTTFRLITQDIPHMNTLVLLRYEKHLRVIILRGSDDIDSEKYTMLVHTSTIGL